MLSLRFEPMTETCAAHIAGWTYEEPYSLYGMDGDAESIAELMNGDYLAALNADNQLIGFICTGGSARVPGGYKAGIYNDDKYIDFGLGLNPEYTGKGQGIHFIAGSLSFIEERYGKKNIRLVVASFNKRAIKVYERAGFIKGEAFTSGTGEWEMEFIAMRLN